MELSVTFETNHIRMQELWLHALDAFLSLDGEDIAKSAWLNPSVVSTLTVFSPYQEECKVHLLQAVAAVLRGKGEDYADSICLLPKAVIRYYMHTGILLIPQQQLDVFCAYFVALKKTSSAHFGAYLDSQRLRSYYGAPANPAEISYEIQAFKSEQLINREGLAVDSTGEVLLDDNLWSVYFDYVSDDYRYEVGRYIALSSFQVTPKDKHVLYEALTGLEEYDALFAALLETGSVGKDIEELSAFFMAVIGGLCGVGFEALARGRYQATPHIPFDMTYTLLLPYQKGVMVFSGGESEYEGI